MSFKTARNNREMYAEAASLDIRVAEWNGWARKMCELLGIDVAKSAKDGALRKALERVLLAPDAYGDDTPPETEEKGHASYRSVSRYPQRSRMVHR